MGASILAVAKLLQAQACEAGQRPFLTVDDFGRRLALADLLAELRLRLHSPEQVATGSPKPLKPKKVLCWPQQDAKLNHLSETARQLARTSHYRQLESITETGGDRVDIFQVPPSSVPSHRCSNRHVAKHC